MRAAFSRMLGLALLVAVTAPASAGSASRVPHPLRGGATPLARSGEVLILADEPVLETLARGALRVHDARLATAFTRLEVSSTVELWHGGAHHALLLTSASAGFDPWAAAAELRATGAVLAAVPNVRMRLDLTLPNDPFLGSQWYVNDGGVADVRLPAAWDVERGSASVRIGIMDTGVDTGHPDLAAKIWTNPGEIAGNGVDDDANGFIDDVHGWDFGQGDNDANPHAIIDAANYGIDIGFHGTMVAGIAAAANDNAVGIAGAGWNCRIVPLKVANLAGDLPLSAVTEAFGYATQQHLEVLNMSLGTADAPGVAEYFQPLVDAATAAGVLCVASAGNDGSNVLNYPAACTGVLSVAATDQSNARASFSNYGPWVRIAAPGSGMWSALCRNYAIDDFSQLFYEVFFLWDSFNPYMYGDGTSFASPLTAGVCALVRSRFPASSPLAVANQVVAAGDAIAFDQPIGPKLNAFRAVTPPLAAPPAALHADVAFAVAPNPFTWEAHVRFTMAAAALVRVCVLDCTGRRVRDLAAGEFGAGPLDIVWDGADDGGRPVRGGLYFIEWERGRERVVRRVARLR